MTGLLPQESRAEEPFNPLKLKGYFWETGKFYEGQTSISESNITKILEELRQTESLLQLAQEHRNWVIRSVFLDVFSVISLFLCLVGFPKKLCHRIAHPSADKKNFHDTWDVAFRSFSIHYQLRQLGPIRQHLSSGHPGNPGSPWCPKASLKISRHSWGRFRCHGFHRDQRRICKAHHRR